MERGRCHANGRCKLPAQVGRRGEKHHTGCFADCVNTSPFVGSIIYHTVKVFFLSTCLTVLNATLRGPLPLPLEQNTIFMCISTKKKKKKKKNGTSSVIIPPPGHLSDVRIL
ncbi:hypothetical protein POVWA1_053660 [Plasmodium ovale wallikeri]|uniref:Uncharacterized protein n=1 Tax=Plasmodium ovale wallikeri TaxID=864142 RepID=A0A1A8ZR75_PLAOA|nr:hypothetical protein POVWA1_053660 [Plasmodium ovale wallikeri]